MARSTRARTARRRTRARRISAAGVLVACAVVSALGYQLLASTPSTASSTVSSSTATAAGVVPRSELPRPRSVPHGALGEADGAVPDGTTVFDDEVAGVAKLDPALLRALRRAATDAAVDGVELVVDSGWRSPEYQEQLLREAVLKYGSQDEAARWVATPDTSAHVSGEAIDVGRDAAAWLSEHGAVFGLCQIYGNEPWHYELRLEAIARGCPRMYADATKDPRTRQSRSRPEGARETAPNVP